MAWTIEFHPKALGDLRKVDRKAASRIVETLEKRIATLENPRLLGRALRGPHVGSYWRYRVGDYRVICEIMDSRLVILVIKIGHRGSVYSD